MAKNSMDLLDLLRKRGMEGDVDFLREALQVLVENIIACPVPRHGGRLRCQGRSAPSAVSATPSGLPTGTAIAAEIGTLGWGRWNCASPRSGPSSMTNRPKAAATSPSPRISTPGPYRPATSLSRQPEQHQRGRRLPHQLTGHDLTSRRYQGGSRQNQEPRCNCARPAKPPDCSWRGFPQRL